MKKWSRLTALVLAFAIVLSTVSGALAQIEIDHGEFQTWVADTKEAEGLSGVISIDEGGEVLVAPSTFTGELNQGPLYTSESTRNLSAYAQGSAPTVDVALGQYSKVELAAPSAGQWQVYLSAADLWVNITGETGSTFALTYAKVKGMIDADGAAKIRCLMGENATETVNVTVRYEDAAVVVNSTATVSQPMVMSARTVAADAQADEPTGKYTILIEYSFSKKNEIPAQPYSATLAAGTSFTATVKHPVVQGYEATAGESADWNDGLTFTATGVEINVPKIDENKTVKVVYQPTNVEYTVIHKQQNVENDDYTIVETETLEDLTDNIVSEVHKTYPGFYSLLYEKPAIAADGSTVVEVYYDRNYYLMNFELGEDAYGTEPIYARYGASIGNVPNPTRPGYTFVGWTLGEDTNPDTASIEALPEKMPAKNRTYKAVWRANDTAKVTVVFWGQDAEGNSYSYDHSGVLYVKPGTEFTYSPDNTQFIICGMTEHNHEDCDGKLTCTIPEHQHSASCCTLEENSHIHSAACYNDAGSQKANNDADLVGAPANPVDGQIYQRDGWEGLFDSYDRVIYIAGSWYEYNGRVESGTIMGTSTNCPGAHTHGDGNCSCTQTAHTHNSECYTYTCGYTEHSHTSGCYVNGSGMDADLWEFVSSETVVVNPDGSSIVNVKYNRKEFTLTFKYGNQQLGTIEDRWGANIVTEFTAMCDAARAQASGYSGWKDSTTGNYVDYIGIMPKMNKTLTVNTTSSSSTSVMTYYVEALDGSDVELFKIQFAGSYNVTTDEYYELEGFTIDRNRSTRTGSSCNGAKFYYTRNTYNLVFNDGYNDVKTEIVKFEAPLGTYSDYVPTPPIAYEPGSVEFGGWYLNPECSGDEFKLNEHQMPADHVLLYAKWVPVTHTVEFYLDSTNLTAGTKLTTHPDLTVSHGKKVETVPATPTNGSYKFVGWFYLDENGAEKAFDFANMPVNRDMKVYGKWSSDVLKEYTVKFMFQKADGTEVEIAETISGQALAGFTKTFNAKGGEELYTDYQAGYFPLVQSHSMTIDINATENNDTNVFIFWYVQKDAVPYIVRYVDANGNELHTQLVKADNRQAVVTENFVVIPGYMPDAYQKRLIVTPSETEDWITVTVDGAEVKVHPDNVITFVYVQDTTHAYYKITHYTEDLNGTSWTEYASSQAVGDIGTPYTGKPVSIDGFTYTKTEYVVDGKVVTEGITDKGVVLTSAGLEINLYYERNSYPYEVRYLEEGTGKQLATPKTSTGLYGEVISESAIDIENYTAVAPTSETLTIRIEESQTVAKLNIIIFYYKENEDTINYVPVGPEGLNTDGTPKETEAGEVSLASETIKVLTGTVAGSTAEPNAPNYKFVGWFTDAKCTTPVIADWVEGTKLVPQKQDHDNVAATAAIYVGATYYAKFEYNVGKLKVTKQASAQTTNDTVPENAEFTFTLGGVEWDSVKYPYTVYNKGENADTVASNGELTSSNKTFTLKNEQYVIIENLLHGANATVTETNSDEYYTTWDSTKVANLTADDSLSGTATIQAGNTPVELTCYNVYRAQVGNLTINKTLQDSTFTAESLEKLQLTFTVMTDKDLSKWSINPAGASVNTVNNTITYVMTLENGAHSGEVTFQNLPIGDYTVTESAIALTKDGTALTYKTYTKSIADDGAAVKVEKGKTAEVEVINTASGTIAELPVTKAWVNDEYVNYRSAVTMHLSATVTDDTTPVYTDIVLDGIDDDVEAEAWTGKWKNLPMFDTKGNEIIYTVSEVAAPVHYLMTKTEGDNSGWTVTNTINVGKLVITKSNMQVGESAIFKVQLADEEIQVVLTGPDASVVIGEIEDGTSYSVTEDGNWTALYSQTSSSNTSGSIKAGEIATASFVNEKKDQWLHDESAVKNVYNTIPASTANN